MQKILVIADDVAFCNLLDKFLTKNNYAVTTSFSAEEAKTKVNTTNFDLIITDLRLPDADGIALLSEFKKTHPTVPVVLMTSYSDVNTAVKAIKNGASDYISKPFNPEEVLLVIKNALLKTAHTTAVIQTKKSEKETPTSKFITGISIASKK